MGCRWMPGQALMRGGDQDAEAGRSRAGSFTNTLLKELKRPPAQTVRNVTYDVWSTTLVASGRSSDWCREAEDIPSNCKGEYDAFSVRRGVCRSRLRTQ